MIKNGEKLCELLEERKINFSGLIRDSRPTITKLRIIGSHQQMMRLDFEEDSISTDVIQSEIKSWFRNQITSKINGVIISDYAKGVCSDDMCSFIIQESTKHGIPVLVDPKGKDWEKYRGATIITPNLKELSDVLGKPITNDDASIELYGKEIRQQYQIKNLIVTRSEKGLSVINSNKISHIPTVAKEVFDVSGAGDTITAILALGISYGLSPMDAAKLANVAAGFVVGKVGTYAIHKEELVEVLQKNHHESQSSMKIMSKDSIKKSVETWRKQGSQIVFTNGCFDLLHIGHIDYLEKAKKLGDYLIIGLNSDASIQSIKGPKRPIVSEKNRAQLLGALECVDAVVIFDEDTPAELIKSIQPDILVKGGDYRPEEVIGREDAGRLELIPFVEGYSTSNLIEQIFKNYSQKDN